MVFSAQGVKNQAEFPPCDGRMVTVIIPLLGSLITTTGNRGPDFCPLLAAAFGFGFYFTASTIAGSNVKDSSTAQTTKKERMSASLRRIITQLHLASNTHQIFTMLSVGFGTFT